MKSSMHQGFGFSAADELMTSRRVVRQPSEVVVSRILRSQDRYCCRGAMGFMVDAFSCSKTSTEHLKSSVSVALELSY